MPSSETNSQSTSNDTHQVLGLAVGLGVGIPVVLVIVVLWFVTVRHKRMAKEEDERHKAIDLDAEISVDQEKARRHRPVPGSTTYLAKQHAASQRSLNASASNHALIAPNARNEHTLSIVSHDTDQADLPYTPYMHEKDSDSLDNLTRGHLNDLDPPNYLKGNGLRSSNSSGSLREYGYRRNSGSDCPSIDSRAASASSLGQSSPMPDRKKSRGHAAVLQIYDEYQYRAGGDRIEEEEEESKRSPFVDQDNSDAFSFDDHRETREFAPEFAAEHSHIDENDETLELDSPERYNQSYGSEATFGHLAPGHLAPGHHPLPEIPQTFEEPEIQDSSFAHSSFNDNSYNSAQAEDYLVTGRSESPRYEDATASEFPQNVSHSINASPEAHPDPLPDTSSVHLSEYDQDDQDDRPASSIYEHAVAPGAAPYSRPAERRPQHTSRNNDWKPVTPQMQDPGFDYHLEATPISPASPLHSVPSLSGISHASGNTSPNAGSRRGSMSEYMPDVPHFNQGIPGSPGSHKQRKRANNGVGNQMTTSSSQSTLDSSVFMAKPSKFNKKNGGKQNKLPSASQMGF